MTELSAIVVVAGATASGKSEFAERLAAEIGGEVINADSQQFYRGFDIGTGKFPASERRVRHWLLDVCAPGERMTAMEFARNADQLIAQLRSQGKTPLLVGGTGLYLRALLEGLDALPPRDPELRTRLQAEYDSLGGEALHRRLAELDPVSAEKISPQDPCRLVRYLEIGELTGKPPSSLMRGKPRALRYSAHSYWFQVEREALRRRIVARVDAMLATGWLEEVVGLMRAGIEPRDLANRPIGYAELAEVVAGQLSLESARERILLKTQQLAKRQETFFRGMFAHSAYWERGSTVEILQEIPKLELSRSRSGSSQTRTV